LRERGKVDTLVEDTLEEDTLEEDTLEEDTFKKLGLGVGVAHFVHIFTQFDHD
jgi:hypothetical protein